jgi:NAD(P)-dependent dehydrogenase (short-subunit alcohol dehydrogenase family)
MATVLITGCSSGFGKLAAIRFAIEGHRVYASMRNVAKAGELRAAADTEGVSLDVVALDVCDSASVQSAVDAIVADAGQLDIVVNNAGIEIHGPVHLFSDDEVARQFDTNVTGVVRVARVVVPHMLARGSGCIVNVGSLAGRVGTPYGGIYAASKHAVEAITEAMHFELSQRGIRVCVVEPGQFATELGNNSDVAAAFTPESAEFDRRTRFRAAQRSLVGGEPADPSLVADAIYAAATDEQWRLRHPVGADAVLVLSAKAQMSFEDFDTTMRATLNWFD